MRVFAIVGFLTASLLAADSDSWRWQGKVPPGKTIEVKGVNGGIHAEFTAGKEVEVSARKTARRSDPAGVRLEVVEHDGGVTICAVYPSSGSGRANQCRPGKEGHMSVQNNDVHVDFTVRAPDGVHVTGRTVNGDVTAEGTRADVEARTVNGRIRISTSGAAEASTVNGSIIASLGNASWSGQREFSTVNGSVEVTLPGSTGAEVHASTVNGRISTDFPLTVHGRFVGGRSISGTIGSGGRELKVHTVNGGIHLKQWQRL